jgi:hypothetical protein
MKKATLFFISVLGFCILQAKAQDYTVGIPVDSSYGAINIMGFDTSCTGFMISITFPPSTVSGIHHMLRVHSALPPGTITETTHGIVNTGDSLIFTSADSTFDFTLPDSSTAHIEIKIEGTPEQAGELYGCVNANLSAIYTGCSYTVTPGAYDSMCVVSGSSFVKDIASDELVVYPNPFASFLVYETSQPLTSVSTKIFDAMGVCIFKKSEWLKGEKLDLNSFSSGIYFLQINDGNQQSVVRILKSE